MSKFAWVTLTTNDTYSLGALVLAHSLKRAKTAHQLAVLVTPTVSQAMRDRLKEVYNVVQEVNVLDSQDAANLALLSRPELGVTFTKLHCWRLVQFEKCVFLDADTLVLQNCDELFEREELSAAPDVSWPDCFNSGVFVFRPSVDTFTQITEFAVKNGSFDGGDQGLLNQFFADWATADIKKHLPFVYNVTAYASYCYLPAFKQFRDKIKILHFAGKLKPWLIQFNSETKVASVSSDYAHAQDLIQLWWNIFCENVIQSLSTEMQTPGRVANDRPEGAIAHGPSTESYNANANANATANAEDFPSVDVNSNELNISHPPEHATSATAIATANATPTATPTPTPSPTPHHSVHSQTVEKATSHQQEHEVAATAQPEMQQQSRHFILVLHVLTSATSQHSAHFHIAGLAGALSQLRIGEQRTPEQEDYENQMRRQCWESGQIDYSGADSFENIWKKISQTLDKKSDKETEETGSS
ncbi:hypothetical protein M5D96_010368 [Drosophila gunungcola]|uniref:glycogenin glucosyltransferase n=1 Tax=Drosophila gunungcola TaxID=103775 RepID=A0A9P9YHT9_9MUSC|nr:hypothetical protein M5D96_010368 [Drosophila gunungcola]